LQGPVVFIDDQIENQTTEAHRLASQIRDSGRPLASYTSLPPSEHMPHWRSLGFLVLDWDLVPGSPGLIGSSTLSEYQRLELFEWLESFTSTIFCPVFIVSAEDTSDIQRQIDENAKLAAVSATGRLAVFSKSSLLDDFVGYIENWVSSRPALMALNIWSNEVEAATNRLFLDMDELASDWPVYVWSNAAADSVDPSFELASILSANLLHRINPLSFDVPAIREHEGPLSKVAMRRVLQGRTALSGERLYATMVQPGDLFAGATDGEFWLNVTPACHTVLNRPSPGSGEAEPDKVILHLVRGQRVDRPVSKSKFGKLKEQQDSPNTAVVHTLLGDDPVVFDFRVPAIQPWGDLKDRRIGRVLPPYITLIQQQHSAFLMNEGLPRVDWNLYDDEEGAD
jgi:hypothetical protein